MHRSQAVIIVLLGLCWLLPTFTQASEKPSKRAAWDYLKASGEAEIAAKSLEKNISSLRAVYKNQEAEISAAQEKLKKELYLKMIEAITSTYKVKELTEITEFLKSSGGQAWKTRNKEYREKLEKSVSEVMTPFAQEIHNIASKALSEKLASEKAAARPASPAAESSDATKADENK